MSYGIMRIEKRGRAAVYGLQIEANREAEDHEKDGRDFDRSDIDWQRTSENVHLLRTEKWNATITKRLRQEHLKERKDSIVMLDGLYTASPEFFAKCNAAERMQYFRDCLAFHIKNYCQDDASLVLNAVVHLDEKTPHMQVASMPIYHDKDGRAHLSAKIVMGGRADFQQRQNAFYESVTKHYGLDRGEVRDASERKKHVEKRDWQIAEQQKRLDEQAAALKRGERKEKGMQQFLASAMTGEAVLQKYAKEKRGVFGGTHYELDEHGYQQLRIALRTIDVAQEQARQAETERDAAQVAEAEEREKRLKTEKANEIMRKNLQPFASVPESLRNFVAEGIEDRRLWYKEWCEDIYRGGAEAYLENGCGLNGRIAAEKVLNRYLSGDNAGRAQILENALLAQAVGEKPVQSKDGGDWRPPSPSCVDYSKPPSSGLEVKHPDDRVVGVGGWRLGSDKEENPDWQHLSEVARGDENMKALMREV